MLVEAEHDAKNERLAIFAHQEILIEVFVAYAWVAIHALGIDQAGKVFGVSIVASCNRLQVAVALKTTGIVNVFPPSFSIGLPIQGEFVHDQGNPGIMDSRFAFGSQVGEGVGMVDVAVRTLGCNAVGIVAAVYGVMVCCHHGLHHMARAAKRSVAGRFEPCIYAHPRDGSKDQHSEQTTNDVKNLFTANFHFTSFPRNAHRVFNTALIIPFSSHL
jgi:hypothetical protein